MRSIRIDSIVIPRCHVNECNELLEKVDVQGNVFIDRHGQKIRLLDSMPVYYCGRCFHIFMTGDEAEILQGKLDSSVEAA